MKTLDDKFCLSRLAKLQLVCVYLHLVWILRRFMMISWVLEFMSVCFRTPNTIFMLFGTTFELLFSPSPQEIFQLYLNSLISVSWRIVKTTSSCATSSSVIYWHPTDANLVWPTSAIFELGALGCSNARKIYVLRSDHQLNHSDTSWWVLVNWIITSHVALKSSKVMADRIVFPLAINSAEWIPNFLVWHCRFCLKWNSQLTMQLTTSLPNTFGILFQFAWCLSVKKSKRIKFVSSFLTLFL